MPQDTLPPPPLTAAPQAARRGAAASHPAALTASARLPRVLVVDDYADCAESVAVLLELCGYEAHTAATAEEGVSLAAAVPLDAIVIDPHLRGGGPGLVARLRAASPRPLAVVVHTSCSAAEAADAHFHGGDLLLPKPADPRDLLAALARLTAVGPRDGA